MTRPQAPRTDLAPITFSALQIDATEPLALAAFYSSAFGIPVNAASTADAASLVPSSGFLPLLFVRTEEPKIWRNRLTLHVVTESFEGHIQRLLELGADATRTDRNMSGERSVEFLDPEGNEFSIAERRVLR